MVAIEWTSGCLTAKQRKALAKEFADILPGRPEDRATYLDAVDEAVHQFRVLYEPLSAQINTLPYRLARLVETSRHFVNSLKQFEGDEFGISVLDAEVFRRGARASEDRLTARSTKALIARLEQVSAAASHLAKKRKPARRGGAIAQLCEDLATSYSEVFGVHPSADGIFHRVVESTFRIAELGKAPEQTKLRTLIRTLRDKKALAGQPPKPGPKPSTP